MPAAHLVSVGPLAGLRAVRHGGAPVAEAHAALAARLEAVAAGLSRLFAEPVLGHDGPEGGSASWYTPLPGPAVPLTELPPESREAADAALRAALARLHPVAADPASRALLAAALLLPGLDDVVLVGGQPVLRNWGFLPAATDVTDPAAHFAATLGRYCDLAPLLWPADAAADAAAAVPPASAPARWYESHLVLAAATVALLIAGAVPSWRAAHDDGRAPTGRFAAAVATEEAAAATLAARRDSLTHQLAGNVCTLDAPRGTPAPPAPTPGPLVRNGPPPPGDAAEPPASMSQLLEHAAALLIVFTPEGVQPFKLLGFGTGFFLSPDTMVTNHHVVEGNRANRVLVTSAAMGDVRPATIVAVSKTIDIGDSDYAVIRLSRPFAGAAVLPIRRSVEKLERVYTAGYPGFVSLQTLNIRALFDGVRDAVPEMTLTSGDVSLIQRQPNNVPVIIHTADISQGNSGGPLVDACGRAVGVNTFGDQDQDSGRRLLASLGAGDLVAFLTASKIAFAADDRPCRGGAR